MALAAVGAGALNLTIAAAALTDIFGSERVASVEIDPKSQGAAEASSAVPPANMPAEQASAPETTRTQRPLDLSQDPLLTSPMLSHPEFRAEVWRWIRIWSASSRSNLPDYLSRMTGFETMVDSVLAAHDLPWSLRYLPLIESGYKPTAKSHAGAVGMWQFMAPTAGDMGVEVTRYIDDRRDPLESTVAAAEFLTYLHGEFDSWFLALAAYNAGPGRIRGIIERHASGAELNDALYWRIRPHLPEETRNYIPNLYGALFVAADPESYGFEEPVPAPFEFDRVPVRGRVGFETVARATGASIEEIERLNPEYVQGMTPSDRQVDLRLPAGSEAAFRAYFSRPAPSGGGGL